MPVFGFGHEVVTSTTKPANPSLGQMIYCTDTDEYLKYASYGGANRWMQAILQPGRNRLINGGFDVWQRGNSRVASGGGATDYSSDRWAFGNNGASSYTVSRQANVPSTRFAYSARVTCNSSANGLNGFVQFIEDVNVVQLRGLYVTLSFWVRGNTTLNGAGYSVSSGTSANQNPGVGNGFTGNVVIASGSMSVTTSWQYMTVTSSVVVPNNAAVMAAYLPRPSTFATNDWIEYAGVQLEVGTAPSDFEFEPYETTLRKCMRYYQTVTMTGSPLWPDTYYSFGYYSIMYPVPMRTAPTGTWSGNVFTAGAGGGTAKSGNIGGDAQRLSISVSGGGYVGWYTGSCTASAEL